jgi:hydrogenase/urease accessory protein HupE
MKKILLGLISFLTLSISVYGHPTGHDGSFMETTWHLVSQPDHLLLIGLSLGVALLVVRSVLRAGKKKS